MINAEQNHWHVESRPQRSSAAGQGNSDMRKPIASMIGGLASALALAGCAVPAVVSIASLAFDGASYAATGKSVQDHAISAVVDEDCALWRAVAGRSICVEKPADTDVASLPVQPAEEGRDDTAEANGSETATPIEPNAAARADERPDSAAASVDGVSTAEATPALADEGDAVGGGEQRGGTAGPVEAGVETGEGRAFVAAAGGQAVRLAAAASHRRDQTAEAKRIRAAKAAGITPHALTTGGQWRPVDSGQGAGLVRAVDSALTSINGSPKPKDGAAIGGSGVYLVFGTFANSTKATIAARRYADFTTRVLRDSREGRSLYRVVAGPYQAGEAHSVREAVAQNGAPHVWLLRL